MKKGTFNGASADERLDQMLKEQMASKPKEKIETTLVEKMKMHLKMAMKTANFPKRNVIRVVLDSVGKEEKKSGKQLTDVEVEAIIRKEVSDMGDMVVVIKEGNGDGEGSLEDLELRMSVLEEYLTPLMSKDDITANVGIIISELGVNSMRGLGQVMGAFNKKFSGKADNNIVREIVTEKLS